MYKSPRAWPREMFHSQLTFAVSPGATENKSEPWRSLGSHATLYIASFSVSGSSISFFDNGRRGKPLRVFVATRATAPLLMILQCPVIPIALAIAGTSALDLLLPLYLVAVHVARQDRDRCKLQPSIYLLYAATLDTSLHLCEECASLWSR